MFLLLDLLRFAWASPWTLLGFSVGVAAWLLGDRVGRTGRVLEFHGPRIGQLLRRVPIRGGASAITLGHVVLAADRNQLQRTREHELVHVRQYERWGPLFIPVYFCSSIVAWSRGGDPYLDNVFERQAFREAQD